MCFGASESLWSQTVLWAAVDFRQLCWSGFLCHWFFSRSGRVVYMCIRQTLAVHLLQLLCEALKISVRERYYGIEDRVGIMLGVAVAGWNIGCSNLIIKQWLFNWWWKHVRSLSYTVTSHLVICLSVVGFYMYFSYVAGVEAEVSVCCQSKRWRQAITATCLLIDPFLKSALTLNFRVHSCVAVVRIVEIH